MARYLPTPKVRTDRPSDAMHIVATIAGITGDTLDLRAVTGMPKHCPQRVQFQAATAIVAVFTDEDDKSHTLTVPAGPPITIDRPVKTLVKAGSGAVQVIAEYWEPPSAQPRNT